MHGGAARSGAPWGNRNARKHGVFTQDRLAERRAIRDLLGETLALLNELEEGTRGPLPLDPEKAP